MIDIKNLSEIRRLSEYPDDTLGLFLFQMVLLFKPERILEIGFFNGYSSLFMAKALRMLKNDGYILSFDNNAEAYNMYKKYVIGAEEDNNISLYIEDSKEGFNLVKGFFCSRTIDMLFIDGDHTYDGCKGDWNTYKDYLSKGAVVLFHDYTLPGVNKCVKEITSESGYYDRFEFFHFPIYHNIVIMRKKDYHFKKVEGQVGFKLNDVCKI